MFPNQAPLLGQQVGLQFVSVEGSNKVCVLLLPENTALVRCPKPITLILHHPKAPGLYEG